MMNELIDEPTLNSVVAENTEELRPEVPEVIDNRYELWNNHLWWCPYFQHHYNCSYLNMPNMSYNYWSQPMITATHANQSVVTHNGQSVWTQHLAADNINVSHFTTSNNGDNNRKEFQIEKLYSCRLCDDMKLVRQDLEFRKHVESHLGTTRPFRCDICTKLFNYRSNCRNHVMAHCVVRKHFVRNNSSQE